MEFLYLELHWLLNCSGRFSHHGHRDHHDGRGVCLIQYVSVHRRRHVRDDNRHHRGGEDRVHRRDGNHHDRHGHRGLHHRGHRGHHLWLLRKQ